jgi:hypothetical protein
MGDGIMSLTVMIKLHNMRQVRLCRVVTELTSLLNNNKQ